MQTIHFIVVLLNLGDEETIQSQAKLLINGDERQTEDALAVLRTCRRPEAIAAMLPFFVVGRKPHLSLGTTIAILDEMLPGTSGFSPEIYAWAKDIKENAYFSAAVIFGEWWKANKDAFARGDFKAVKVLPLEKYKRIEFPPGFPLVPKVSAALWELRSLPETLFPVRCAALLRCGSAAMRILPGRPFFGADFTETEFHRRAAFPKRFANFGNER